MRPKTDILLTPPPQKFSLNGEEMSGIIRGGTMKTLVGVFEPRDIEVLKEVFDSIWLHLERIGRVHGNDDNVRSWISAQVISCAQTCDRLEFDGLKTTVLKTLHQ
jgi:hypothetical protein